MEDQPKSETKKAPEQTSQPKSETNKAPEQTSQPKSETNKAEKAFWVDGFGVTMAKSQEAAEKKVKNILSEQSE